MMAVDADGDGGDDAKPEDEDERNTPLFGLPP